MIRNKRRWSKGEMMRTIVLYCIRVLTMVLIWAAALKTYAVVRYGATDLSDVLGFAGAAFGAELLMMAAKKYVVKRNRTEDE